MTPTNNQLPDRLALSSSRSHKRWTWMLVFGICLLIQGIISLVDATVAAVASMYLAGWILIAAGIIGGIMAIRHRSHRHLVLYLLGAVLAIVVGVILLRHPGTVARFFALLVAVYFVVLGVFHIVLSLRLRDPGWGWMLFAGIVILILGILIWARWPVSGLWVLGLFIGINLVALGGSQVMMALALRSTQVVNPKTGGIKSKAQHV